MGGGFGLAVGHVDLETLLGRGKHTSQILRLRLTCHQLGEEAVAVELKDLHQVVKQFSCLQWLGGCRSLGRSYIVLHKDNGKVYYSSVIHWRIK